MDIKEFDILGGGIDSHWYYRSKAKAVMRLIGNDNVFAVLDVGAGSGFFSKTLLAKTEAKKAWCVDTSYGGDSDFVEAGKTVYFRRYIDAVDVDLVLMMDVLEHVDDDVGLLKEYASKVPRGTVFLISVPAFQFLWSDHDVFLEHKRRYTLNQINSVIERAGLTVTHCSYYFGVILPVVAAVRVFNNVFRKGARPPKSQLKQHGVVVNGVLEFLSHAELSLMRLNGVAGLTAFCLAKSR